MKCWPHKIEAVIFDCDGVLMDTISMYAKANSIIIGRDYPDEFQVTVNGLAEPVFAQRVIEGFGLDMTPDEFVRRRSEILHDLFPEAQLVPGVEAIAKRIHAMGIPMAVATSSDRGPHERKIVKHGEFFSMFKYQLCGDEVVNAKPAPEIFQKAAAKLGNFAPEHVLVFEDAVNGIKAACAAGMASVFLASPPGQDYDSQFKKAGVTPSYVVDAFKDFDFEKFEWAQN